MAIVVSKGSLEGVYPALIMANGARMDGIEADLFFTFFGLEAIRKDRASDEAERLIFRTAQEALRNVRDYAAATTCHLFAYAAAEETWQHERPDRHAGSLNRTGR